MPNFSELKPNVRAAFPKLPNEKFEACWSIVDTALGVGEFDMDIKEADATWDDVNWGALDIPEKFVARVKEEIRQTVHGTYSDTHD
jgi:hypothetical protein